ncbi:MAG: hypothetical protein Q7S22_08860 [Candidatus Micrarchaeota archaeon]|nr:hypothetical protein [Candidatus Micrarchaeota archaeon]
MTAFVRPTKIRIYARGKWEECRIKYSKTPKELFEGLDSETERLATLPELVRLRICTLEPLVDMKDPDIVKKIRDDPETYGIWSVRITTMSLMIRAIDKEGKDIVFFHDGNPFANKDEIRSSFEHELSDGGIKLSDSMVDRAIRAMRDESCLTHEDYLKAKGGNFTSTEFAQHPVFKAACPDETLRTRYSRILDKLDSFGFYNLGMHSLWRPGEMKIGYGRFISLGFKGEAFYPPNSSTVDHAVLVLPLGIDILPGIEIKKPVSALNWENW